MKRIIKRILAGLLLVFVGIQFFRPARNISSGILAQDITHIYGVPKDVQGILKTACYDCHSNNTNYPWYMNIQPAAWFMAHHVKEGKAELNFSEFGSYSRRKQGSKLKSIASQVKKNEMPLKSYTLLHPDAVFDETEKAIIVQWAASMQDSLNQATDSMLPVSKTDLPEPETIKEL